MSIVQTSKLLTQPVILSMEVDDDDTFESEYRLQFGDKVKYLIISPQTFERDTLSFPLQSLPYLPYNEEWTVAHISRDKASGDLKTLLSNRKLAGVSCQWHPTQINCLELKKTKQLTAKTFEAVLNSSLSTTLRLPTTVIAKIARFEWEIPQIEKETRAYRLLNGTGLTPLFLGHIHENGRVMGFLVEKIEGRPASFNEAGFCKTALGKLHKLGHRHGDVNRYNFLVTNKGARLIDFECLVENASPASIREEMETVSRELVSVSGCGGGFIFNDD